MREHTIGKYYTCSCCGREFYTNYMVHIWPYKIRSKGKNVIFCSEKCKLEGSGKTKRRQVTAW